MKILRASEVESNPNTGTYDTIMSIGTRMAEMGHDVNYLFSTDCRLKFRHPVLNRTFFGIALFYEMICRKTTYDAVIISGANSYLGSLMRIFGLTKMVAVQSHGPYKNNDTPHGKQQARSLKTCIIDFIYKVQCYLCEMPISAQLIIVPTKAHYKLLPPSLAKRTGVITYGLDDNFLTAVDARQIGGLIKILYVGSWIERKGVNHLEDAISKLIENGLDFQLTIISDLSESIKQRLSEKFKKKLTVKEPVPRDRLIQEYDQHDVFIFPSLSEGYGKVIVEAMARGMCVVTTPVGIAEDIVVDGQNGYIIEPGSTEAIYNKLKDLLENPTQVNKVSSAARNSTAELGWKKTAEQTLGYLADCLDKQR